MQAWNIKGIFIRAAILSSELSSQNLSINFSLMRYPPPEYSKAQDDEMILSLLSQSFEDYRLPTRGFQVGRAREVWHILPYWPTASTRDTTVQCPCGFYSSTGNHATCSDHGEWVRLIHRPIWRHAPYFQLKLKGLIIMWHTTEAKLSRSMEIAVSWTKLRQADSSGDQWYVGLGDHFGPNEEF